MFIGHFGIGFGAKKLAPALSLGWLLMAAQFVDLLWPTLLLLDVEHVSIAPGITKVTPLDFYDYPVSHSLLMAVVWGLAIGAGAWLVTRSTRILVVMFLCVVSHWVLDLVTHRPDLPLYPGGSFMSGLGLWNYPLLTAIAEVAVFSAGVFFYYRSTAAKNRFGKFGLAGLVVFLLLIQVANMAGPPPPNVEAIAWAGHLQWLFVVLGFFIDRNRVVTTS